RPQILRGSKCRQSRYGALLHRPRRESVLWWDPLIRLLLKNRVRFYFLSLKLSRILPIARSMGATGELFSGRPRILIVDDDGDLRLTLCEFLQSRSFVVSSARDGHEAISMIQAKPHGFDIIFTDLVMGNGPDGLDVLKLAKQLNPLSCVVVMTGYSSISTAIE